jgi:hypothetical protein
VATCRFTLLSGAALISFFAHMIGANAAPAGREFDTSGHEPRPRDSLMVVARGMPWKASWIRAFPWLVLPSLSDRDCDRAQPPEELEVGPQSNYNDCLGNGDDDDDDRGWLEFAWSCARLSGRRPGDGCVLGASPTTSACTRTTAADPSLGYGEILPRSVWTVLFEWLPLHGGGNEILPPTTGRLRYCIVDLGSGSGRALLAAGLGVVRQVAARRRPTLPKQRDDHHHLRLIGIEVDPAWEQVAKRNYQRLFFGYPFTEHRRPDPCNPRDGDGDASPHPRVRLDASFVTADFTRWTAWASSTSSASAAAPRAAGAGRGDEDEKEPPCAARLVLCHATVFGERLMGAAASACALCPPGTWFVLVSRPLEHPGIETVREGPLEMSWGLATVYLQRRS